MVLAFKGPNGGDNKIQILDANTMQPISFPMSPGQTTASPNGNGDSIDAPCSTGIRGRMKRVACSCPNCKDGDGRYVLV